MFFSLHFIFLISHLVITAHITPNAIATKRKNRFFSLSLKIVNMMLYAFNGRLRQQIDVSMSHMKYSRKHYFGDLTHELLIILEISRMSYSEI